MLPPEVPTIRTIRQHRRPHARLAISRRIHSSHRLAVLHEITSSQTAIPVRRALTQQWHCKPDT